jgi:hypothetical protein
LGAATQQNTHATSHSGFNNFLSSITSVGKPEAAVHAPIHSGRRPQCPDAPEHLDFAFRPSSRFRHGPAAVQPVLRRATCPRGRRCLPGVVAKRCLIQRSPLPESQDRGVKVLRSRTIRRRLRGSTNSCHIRHMAKGWKIVTVLPNPGGASPLQEWALVAIPDKAKAIRRSRRATHTPR